MANGLKRVILIDSCLTGMISEVSVDGHTVINGDNGKGKTSLLRLVPIFYGARPSDLLKKGDGGTLGFTEFYLPRQGSYVVFEYKAHDQLKMAVFIAVNNDPSKHRQILIDAPYDSELFSDQNSGSGLPSASLIQRIDAKGYPREAVKSLTDYRKTLLQSGRSNYSLATQGSQLKDLLPLLVSMFKKKADFDDLAKIIQHWCFDSLEEDSKNAIENFGINKSEIEQWVADFDAVSDLDRRQDKNNELNLSIDELHRLEQNLSAIVMASEALYAVRIKEKQDGVTAFEKETTTFNTGQADLSLRIEQEKTEQHALTATHNLAKAERDDLTAKHQYYVDKKVPEFERELHVVDAKKSQQSHLEKTRDEELSAVIDVRMHVAEQKQSLATQLTIDVATIEDSKEKHNDTHQKQVVLLNTEQDKVLTRFDKQVRSKESDLQSVAKKAFSEFCEAKAGIQTAAASKECLATLQASIDHALQLEDKREDEQEKVDLANDGLTKAKEDRLQADRNLQECIDDIERLGTGINAQMHLRGEPGTLIDFLRLNNKGWEATFGKVFNTQTLLSKNLSPLAIDDADPETILGVRIAIDNLPTQIEEIEKIEANITRLNAELKQAEKDEGEADKSLDKAHKHALTQEAVVLNLQKALASVKSQILVAKDLIKTNQHGVEREQQDAAKLAAAQATEKEASNTKAEGALTNYTQETTFHRGELKVRFNSHLNEKKEALSTAIKTLNSQKSALNLTYEAQEKDLDDEMIRALEGKGIDPNKTRQRDLNIAQLGKEVVVLTKKAVEYATYVTFVEMEYSALPSKDEACKKAEVVLNKSIEQLKARKERFTINGEQFNVKRTAFDERQSLLEKEANRLLNNVIDVKPDTLPAIEDGGLRMQWGLADVTKITTSFQQYLKDAGEANRRLRSQATEFVNVFRSKATSVCYGYWEAYILPHWGNDDMVKTAEAVCNYYNFGSHKDHVEQLNYRLKMLRSINSYREYIEEFEGRVKSFGRALNREMDESVQFKSLTKVEASLSFTPRNLEHWSDIESLSSSFQKWNRTHGADKHALPEEDIVAAMRNFYLNIPEGRIDGHASELWRKIKFRFQIIENGNEKTIETANGINNASSTGLSYLILIVTFLGFIDMYRGKVKTPLAWSLDELSNIDSKNVDVLLDMLEERNISLVAACPQLNHAEKEKFTNKYMLEQDGLSTIIIDQSRQILLPNPFEQADIKEAVQ
ncbi:MAG: ATP-binding protein [Piscirickettsiaceae bacterium]|nr:ATP-binding protein [Piscirickettsiaceae bacterium]